MVIKTTLLLCVNRYNLLFFVFTEDEEPQAKRKKLSH